MPLTALVLYCSESDVAAVLSALGVSLRLDDDRDGVVSAGEQSSMDFALGDATETVNFSCWEHYTPAWLVTSPWVNRRAAWLAAMALCERRGNPCPEVLLDRCEKILEELELIATGKRGVPNLPRALAGLPEYWNTRADPRYTFRVLRVERRTSSRHRQSKLPVVQDWDSAWSAEL